MLAEEDLPEGASETPSVEVRQWQVESGEHGQRLDRVLVSHAGEFSRTHLQGLIERGCVWVGGEPVHQASRRIKAGCTIKVELHPTEQAQAFRPEVMNLAVAYEDDHLLIIDKPVGLVVHPAPGHWSGTLLNGLLARDPGAAALPRAGIVHRLDKDTSGLMLVGKTPQAVQGLVQAIAQRQVKRHYRAIVHGRIALPEQTVDQPIGRDPVSRVRMAVVAHGKPSQTTITVQGHAAAEVSAIECRLHTGRTHQIRVHLSHLGHPLVGDELYGGRVWQGVQRQALHAWRLALEHPCTGQALCATSPMPTDLASAWVLAGGATI